MANMSVQNAVNTYGANALVPQPRPERVEQTPQPTQTDKALTVTLSDQAKARQAREATLQAEQARANDSERAVQERSRQVQEVQAVAGKPGKRIDLTV